MNQIQVKCVELKKIKNEHYGRFIFQPLQANFALTLGNALRRTLLGNLVGSAIVGIRIAGISHEFSVIPGVREDTLELLLNLKEVIVVNTTKKEQFGRLSVIGPKIITARDINFPNEVQIINPDHYLASINLHYSLEIEFKVENGIGYRLAKPITSRKDNDFLDIDAIFMPIKRVNFGIEKVYKNELEFAERLVIELWTNGSIEPDKALINAAKLLSISFFQIFAQLQFMPINFERDSLIQRKDKVLGPFLARRNIDLKKISINELNLSNRAYKGLKQAGITTIDELIKILKTNPKQLKQVRNFGKKSFQEVISLLSEKYNFDIDVNLG